uniref:BZIP domain-containing protein n=1 Tax=Octactis speculum TaxID=3111310 RepID=A0A7S2D0P8_9STRA|mmetsp:Transcript_4129/g.4834  ORF Transcript_4129/g.4834 Transcript_4129/m.4834 type:complete len:467 (+) Transcript_4129:95-1495(+)|eukprot:CAMPEP_0185769816 /NCGR_PEP_ID=MMETSP1174-20130828/56007_1 /TAXON_ID=35687 /ORGANISM="Dictyocha speculum, Strain CCMP1381" /LENGTH=466 /DNA_ID=CAMNT_0028455023 /DNA_START=95 /DNA_END=1495 /DNA_ORIENTATION=+
MNGNGPPRSDDYKWGVPDSSTGAHFSVLDSRHYAGTPAISQNFGYPMMASPMVPKANEASCSGAPFTQPLQMDNVQSSSSINALNAENSLVDWTPDRMTKVTYDEKQPCGFMAQTEVVAAVAGRQASSQAGEWSAVDYGAVCNPPTRVRNRQTLTAEEKSKQSRDRNRQHARNTRLRKKAFVSKLVALVEKQKEDKVQQDRERELEAACAEEKQTVRSRAVRTFLDYRGVAETSHAKWSLIVNDSIEVTQPVTPYRSSKHDTLCDAPTALQEDDIDETDGTRSIKGIAALREDMQSLQRFYDSIGSGSDVVPRRTAFTIPENGLVIQGDVAMTRWHWSTLNAVECGAMSEVTSSGMLWTSFTDQNKLSNIHIMFDVRRLIQQLQPGTTRNESPPLSLDDFPMSSVLDSYGADIDAIALGTARSQDADGEDGERSNFISDDWNRMSLDFAVPPLSLIKRIQPVADWS